jgi:hypothetical protein
MCGAEPDCGNVRGLPIVHGAAGRHGKIEIRSAFAVYSEPREYCRVTSRLFVVSLEAPDFVFVRMEFNLESLSVCKESCVWFVIAAQVLNERVAASARAA